MKKNSLLAFLNLAFISFSMAAPSSSVLSDEELKQAKQDTKSALEQRFLEYKKKHSTTNSTTANTAYKIIFPNSNPYTTKADLVKIEGIVPDEVYSIVVDDYKLKKYKPGDIRWYYYAAKKYDSLKDGINTYVINYYDKQGKLLKQDELVIYKKIDEISKINEYTKKMQEKLFEMKNSKDVCNAYTKQNYDSLIKRKAKADYYRKKYNRENNKNITEGINPMDKYKYFYDKDAKTCVAKRFFSDEVGFNSFEECNICKPGNNQVTNNIIPTKPAGPNTIYNPNYTPKASSLYSRAKLSIIADSIIKRNSGDLKKLQDLQLRAKGLINTLENGNLKIKYSTKVNFLNLLKILNSKIETKVYEELNKVNIYNTPEVNDNQVINNFEKNTGSQEDAKEDNSGTNTPSGDSPSEDVDINNILNMFNDL